MNDNQPYKTRMWEPVYSWHFTGTYPNRFHRIMQRVLLGIKWSKLK